MEFPKVFKVECVGEFLFATRSEYQLITIFSQDWTGAQIGNNDSESKLYLVG